MGLIDDHLNEPVVITRKGGVNPQGGQYAFNGGTNTAYAWVRDQTGTIPQADGKILTYRRIIYFDADTVIEVGDRVTVGDEEPQEVFEVTRSKGIGGDVDHFRCMVGSR